MMHMTFADSLKLVLEACMAEGCPTIEQAAALIGTSSRTLRRRLASEGITYSRLVDQVRFDIARRLLCESNIKMIDITYTLGFSDPSHFARSIRRLAGMSPKQYRMQLHLL